MTNSNNYSEKVKEHFLNPRNMGDLDEADASGKVGNPVCGDVMQVFIKVGEDNQGEKIIKDIRFKTFGCIAAIATSSMITELAKEKTLEEAKNITMNDVAESLEGLPPVKMHCSNLASDALKEAIENYENPENKKEI